MTRLLFTALLLVVAYALYAGPARAHYDPPKKEPWRTMTLGEKHRWLHELEAHALYVKRFGSGEPRRWHSLALVRIRRALRQVHAAMRPRLYVPRWAVNGFLCIHRYEGAWNANTGNGYFGGLQMDRQFQRSYAPRWLRRRGTADRWSPWQQIWVAYRAHRSGRGFYPWPNTARRCGLI